MSEVGLIDFSQVLETSQETLRLSRDNTKSFVKWDGNTPEFLSGMTTTQGPYSYSQILDILQTQEWSSPIMED